MSRKKPVMTRRIRRHDEHTNHEAWAIPYGDLVTLLLAFFVVMYAISSVNAGKYRVLSDSLFAAFRGAPRTMDPIQVGEKPNGSGAEIDASIAQSTLQGQQRSSLAPVPVQGGNLQPGTMPTANHLAGAGAAAAAALQHLADEVTRAMDDLVKQNLVVVRRTEFWIEVEIKTDILYPSGSAHLAPYAVDVIQRLGGALAPFPNPIRVEGHTDNKPISTVAFYSNWELSAARAGSVVRVLQAQGVGPERLAVIGYGDTRPVQPNDSEQGRNANRRVVVVILSTELQRQKSPADQPDGLSPIPPSTSAPAAAAPTNNATALQPGAAGSAMPFLPDPAAPAGTTTPSGTTTSASTATTRQPASDGGTPATAFPAPATQATLATPGEAAQLPRRVAPPGAAPAEATAARTTANVTLSTSGAHVAGNGMVPAP
jgi:chemotaxis protein MotB